MCWVSNSYKMIAAYLRYTGGMNTAVVWCQSFCGELILVLLAAD